MLKKSIIFTLIACLCYVLVIPLQIPVLKILFKLLASTGFVAAAVIAGARSSAYGKFILFGLVFSWFGDAFLAFPGELSFQFGLASFLLGHLFYGVAFLRRGVAWRSSLMGLLLVGIVSTFVTWWLFPHLPENLYVPVAAYIVVITFMLTLAVGAYGKGGPWQALVGAILFYCSDITVAADRFVMPEVPTYIVGAPLYFISQLFLAVSVRQQK